MLNSLTAYKGTYLNNGVLAIRFEKDGEPYSQLTTNLSLPKLITNEMVNNNNSFVDINNCPREIIDELEINGFIINQNYEVTSGFVKYPLYHLTDKFLNECITI